MTSGRAPGAGVAAWTATLLQGLGAGSGPALLQNNLDPEVMKKTRDRLVVYGGSGRAARKLGRIRHHQVATLKKLENDETLLVQSGKPVGVLRNSSAHEMAPRVLIANSLLVPRWATWEEFRRLETMGLTMFGQMTAGELDFPHRPRRVLSRAPTKTFAACGRRHFGSNLAGRLVVTAGLGGMGGAQPLAATMNGRRVSRRRGQSRTHRTAFLRTWLPRPHDAQPRRGPDLADRGENQTDKHCRSVSSATRRR